MKKLTLMSSAILIAGAVQVAQAQPPGGGGRFANMSFDAINQADEDGNKDDHLTIEELRTFFEERAAAGGPGGGGPGGGGPGGGGGFGGGPGGGDFVVNIFGRWDANEDGMITATEFEERPRGRGPGGPPPQ